VLYLSNAIQPELYSELYSYIEKSPAATIAIYLSSLYRYFYHTIEGIEENIMSLMLSAGLSPQELIEAQNALNMFIRLINEHEKRKIYVNEFLESLEEKYYERFKDALYRYVKKEAEPSYVKKIIDTLLKLRATRMSQRTKKGSFRIYSIGRYSISSLNIEARGDDLVIEDRVFDLSLSLKRLRELGFYVVVTKNIDDARNVARYDIIVPAPYMDMDILKLFEASKKVEAKETERARVPAGIKPSREVLEGIVAGALKSLGFAAQTNVRLPAKGGDIEADVWAVKGVGGSQFRVYVSCKNWDKDVDRQVIDHEFGRVLQLYQLPHLRILVAKSLTEPARKAAFDDGFFVIELGDKADAENAQEIYEIIYNKFKEIFIGIAPEKVLKAIDRLREAMKYLEEII
jgi:hypothetical protein